MKTTSNKLLLRMVSLMAFPLAFLSLKKDYFIEKTFSMTPAIQDGQKNIISQNPKGMMILSDRDTTLAINAWNGARHGGELRLHNACRPTNPDCTWIYTTDRMLLSARDPSLAIKAWNDAKHGGDIRLSNNCSANNRNCTWTYRGGMFISDMDTGVAINAWNGAKYGAELKLHERCLGNNPDCTWKFWMPSS
jgi:hypothetical protein